MGVKDLWNILSPISERKPLYELQGKTIAIDLSCWVVDSQNVADNAAQPKLYLRNLFFRTSYFLLHNIFPVFVLEGEAPVLKHKTIAKRNNIRHGNQEDRKVKKAGRTRFNHVLKECEEMLRYMGVTCVKGYGEAEAMCAYLNNDGLVDGCISQDSDCFLYGAAVVYRNFCTNTQGNRTTSGGSIDQYSMEKIQNVFNLGRNKMIALALLCGCDYNEGLNGVGKEAALKLFKMVDDDEILNRMKQWKTDEKFSKLEFELSNPNICTNCGHTGKLRSHTKLGCLDCNTSIKCNESYKEKRTLILNELAIRKKALMVENFPDEELINEFLVRKGPVPSELDLKWKKPIIMKFIEFMEKKVQWDASYAFAKIFPLMTRWQLANLIELPLEVRVEQSNTFIPEKIKKIRNIRSVASYEILWIDKDNLLDGLILSKHDSEKENDEEDPDTLSELVSIEPQEKVHRCYPTLVEEFETERNLKKKKPIRSRKKRAEENSAECKIERKRREKSKSGDVINNRKILDFVSIKEKKTNEASLEESFGQMSITAKRRKKSNVRRISSMKKRGPQFEKIMTTERMDAILNGSLEMMFNQLTPSDFTSDAENSIDMTLIIENICKKKCNPQSVFIEYQEDVKNDESSPVSDIKIDEFDALEKSYVPLDTRLIEEKKSRSVSVRESSKAKAKERFSLGIDSLLNGTDD